MIPMKLHSKIKKPTHISVKIEDVDFEISRLKALLFAQPDNDIKRHLQGQLEAYLAVRMQRKVFIAPLIYRKKI